jgi:putative transposase
MPGPRRKSPRLREYDYATAGAYLVTVCVRNRACLFGSIVNDELRPTSLGWSVAKCWAEISTHFPEVELDAFVVMPNHVHGIVWLPEAGVVRPLHVIVGSFKSAVSRTAARPIWQRSFHDRVIRGEQELAALRHSIAENPLRWAIDRENRLRLE